MMNPTPTPDLEQLLATAQRAIIAFRDAPSDATEDPVDEALAALDCAAQRAIGLGIYIPVSADVIIPLFEFATSDCRQGEFRDLLAALHARTLDDYPPMAAFIRSAWVLTRVRDIAGVHALYAAGELYQRDAAPDVAVDKLVRMIVADLVGRPGFEPAATILHERLPALFEQALEPRAVQRTRRAAAGAA